MKESMRHIDKIIIKHTSESRAASSCSSDIDRQELINNYGSEKYLSKWSLEGQDRNVSPDTNTKTTDHKKSGESQPPDKNLAIDDDSESLVSYNSVRDGNSATTSYLPYQIQPQPRQDKTLWQGYSGNIYFDPVQCRSVHINSSKPIKTKPKEKTPGTYRLTKSCSPAVETHTLNDNHGISRSASSYHSLGSLRIGSREKKRKHTRRTQSQYGRLYKGFIDGKEKDPRRCQSTPESLVIAGGHVNGKTDPIDSVFRHNTKAGLASKSRESLNDCQNFPFLSIERKWNKEIKVGGDNYSDDLENCTNNQLPRVDQMSATSAEPTPVFIIPFATLDDPVEPDITTIKQKKRDSIKSDKVTPKPKDDTKLTEKVIPKPKTVSVVNHTERPIDCEVQPDAGCSVVAHVVNVTGKAKSKTSPRNTTEFEVRREISNSSLSNYLQAVPSQYSKTFPLQKQKKSMPKLSYTQRTRDSRPTDLILDGIDKRNVFSQTTAMYGGYLPSMRAADTQNFHAEISSEASESDSVTSLPREERRHVTHGHPTKSCLKKPSTDKEHPSNENCHLPVIGWHVS